MQALFRKQQYGRNGEIGDRRKFHRQHDAPDDKGIHNGVSNQIGGEKDRAQHRDDLPAFAFRALTEPIGQHVDAAEKYERDYVQTVHKAFTSIQAV